MPKGPGHFSERAGWNSSKNVKDKSNNATAWVSLGDRGHRGQAGPGALGGLGGLGVRLSHFDSGKDSEKDSGYSEAGSDSVQNDLDDQHSSVSQPHRKNSRSAVTTGNNNNNRSGIGGANRDAGRYEELTPVYVIKDLVVNQSRPEPLLHQPLMWAGGWHSLSGTKGPTQLLLIQQQPAIVGPPSTSFSTLTTVSTPADTLSRANKKSCSSRTSSKNHRHHAAGKNSYLPILNSYPRIAPHPRKEAQTQGKSSGALGRVKESGGSSGGGGGGEGQSQKKRVCTEEESVSTTARNLSSHHHHHHHHHHHGRHRDLHHSQQKVRRDSDTPAHPPSASHAKSYGRSRHSSRSNAVGLPSVSSSQMPCLPSHSSSSNSPSSASSSSSSCTTSYSSPSSLVAHSPYRPRPGRARSAAVTVAAAAAAASGYLSDSLSECSSVGQRRFLNTEEILSQSGLLAITLRTKELLKQSDAAEREIAQLRQHTQLLCRAALASQRVPCNGSDVLQHLLGDMAHSGSYPGILETSGHGKAVGDNQKQSKRRGEAAKGEGREAEDQGRVKNTEQQQLVSPRGVDEGAAPSLFALSPEAEGMEQVNSLVGSLFMDKELTELTLSPESFTFDNYLF